MKAESAKIIRLDDEAAVAGLDPRFAAAFAFLRRPDIRRLQPGRYAIDGEKVFAVVSDNSLKIAGEIQRPEFHKRYADVQMPLTGEEIFGLPPLPPEVAAGPFDDEKDIAFFEASCPLKTVRPGECIVFEPFVAHAPCLGESPAPLRKVVVKVAFD